MMKKYKAIKPTIKAVKITDDVSFYENQWIKKILCIRDYTLQQLERRFAAEEKQQRLSLVEGKDGI